MRHWCHPRLHVVYTQAALMNHGGKSPAQQARVLFPHQLAFIFRADSLEGCDLPVQIQLNRKKQGTYSGAEPPSSSSHSGQHRKRKNSVREEHVRSNLWHLLKLWGLHSRRVTGYTGSYRLNPKGHLTHRAPVPPGPGRAGGYFLPEHYHPLREF